MINTILIADDSSTARMIIKKCLEIVGYSEANFLEAVNGAEALAIAKRESIDLVVTDINMPVMDGRQFLARIKSSPRLTSLPVLVITSTSNPTAEKEFLELGAFAVLNKPVNPQNLAEVLENMTDQPNWGI